MQRFFAACAPYEPSTIALKAYLATLLTIYFVMASNIKQHYLFFTNCKGKRNAIAVGETDCMTAFEPTLEGCSFRCGAHGSLCNGF